MPASLQKFPDNFLWGAATAAHQVEGNNVNSDLWVLENVKPTLFAEPSGDACDHYHRYADDIKLLAGLGFNTYRFSIEWAHRARGGLLLARGARPLSADARGLPREPSHADGHVQPLHAAALA